MIGYNVLSKTGHPESFFDAIFDRIRAFQVMLPLNTDFVLDLSLLSVERAAGCFRWRITSL